MKKRLLLTSILSIVMCFSLICGATFALFTSESKVNIAVTSGTVDITATVGTVETGSTLGTAFVQYEEVDGVYNVSTMVAGDYIKFPVSITSSSNVDIMYRIRTALSGELAEEVSVVIENANGAMGNNAMTSWIAHSANVEKVDDYTITISLDKDNETANGGKELNIQLLVEAVQGNAVSSTPTTATQLENALNYGGVVTLGADIVLDKPIVVKAGVVATLDFAGKTISTSSDFVGTHAIETSGNLTLINNPVEGASMVSTFAVRFEETTSAVKGGIESSVGAILNKGTLTIAGGEYVANSGAVITVEENAQVEINGGSFVAEEQAVIIDGNGKATLEDGTFDGVLVSDRVIDENVTLVGGVFTEEPNIETDTVIDKDENGNFIIVDDSLIATTQEELSALVKKGGKVYLGANIEVTGTIKIPAGVKVDLNLSGYTLAGAVNSSDTEKHIYPLDNYGDFTITNGTITGRGIYNRDSAKITVNGATIISQDWNGGACIWSYGTGEVYLNNANLTGNTGVVSSDGYLEINGGTYICYSGIKDDGTNDTDVTYNIRAYNGLKITDGTFTSRHGVIYFGGGVGVIENGSFTIEFMAKTTSNVVYVYGNADLTINGGEFLSDNTSGKADSGAAVLVSGTSAKVTINDGTFSGMNGMVGKDEGNANTVIYGGSYSTVFDYNHYDKLENLVAQGYEIVENEDGSLSVIEK